MQEIQFICLCKMSSFAPHICSQSSNREELITVSFHESKVHFLSWPSRLNFSNAAHSWPDKWVSKGTAKKKLPLQINFICLPASWHLTKRELNSHTGCTVCFKSVRGVFYEYTQGFNLPLSDSPGRWKPQIPPWWQFSAHRKCRLISNSIGAKKVRWAVWYIVVALKKKMLLFMFHKSLCCLLCLWFQHRMRYPVTVSGRSNSDSHLFTLGT